MLSGVTAPLLSPLCLNLTFSSVELTVVLQDYLKKKKKQNQKFCLVCLLLLYFCFFLSEICLSSFPMRSYASL